MPLAHIVAVAEDGAIGRDNKLLWHIPEDLAHFQKMTMGFPVIMGRKTVDSLPAKGLPGRKLVTISKSPAGWDLQDALDHPLHKDAFIAGGAEIYKQTAELVDDVYLTEVVGIFPDADSFYFVPSGMRLVHRSTKRTYEGQTYRFCWYQRAWWSKLAYWCRRHLSN